MGGDDGKKGNTQVLSAKGMAEKNVVDLAKDIAKAKAAEKKDAAAAEKAKAKAKEEEMMECEEKVFVGLEECKDLKKKSEEEKKCACVLSFEKAPDCKTEWSEKKLTTWHKLCKDKGYKYEVKKKAASEVD